MTTGDGTTSSYVGTIWMAPQPTAPPHLYAADAALTQLQGWCDAGYNPQLTATPRGWVLVLQTHNPLAVDDGRYAERGASEPYLRFITAAHDTIAAAVEAAQEVLQ